MVSSLMKQMEQCILDFSECGRDNIADWAEKIETVIALIPLVCQTSECEIIESVALQFFTTVQCGMQSGPLRGARPGYFRRKKMDPSALAPAISLLTSVSSHAAAMGFTTPQRNQVESWLCAAEARAKRNDRN